MPDKITYYVIVGGSNTVHNPRGLVRRLEHKDGPSDKALRDDFSWKSTPMIIEWERGDFDDELVGSATSMRARSSSTSGTVGAVRAAA